MIFAEKPKHRSKSVRAEYGKNDKSVEPAKSLESPLSASVVEAISRNIYVYVCTLYILYHIIRSSPLRAILRAILRPTRAKSHSIKRKEAQRLQNCEFACTKHFQPRPNRIGNVRTFQVRTNWIYSNREFSLHSKPIAWHMFPFLRSYFHPTIR